MSPAHAEEAPSDRQDAIQVLQGTSSIAKIDPARIAEVENWSGKRCDTYVEVTSGRYDMQTRSWRPEGTTTKAHSLRCAFRVPERLPSTCFVRISKAIRAFDRVPADLTGVSQRHRIVAEGALQFEGNRIAVEGEVFEC